MQLKEMIDLAAEKAGDKTNLAKVIGVGRNNLYDAQAGKRGLPAEACGKLANIIEVDPWKVLAASNLVTEKNEKSELIGSLLC